MSDCRAFDTSKEPVRASMTSPLLLASFCGVHSVEGLTSTAGPTALALWPWQTAAPQYAVFKVLHFLRLASSD